MSDPWFKFYPSDWLGGTRGLTAAETGIYITLIAMMYERAAPIDMDKRRLARLCGCPAGAFNRCLQSLIDAGKIVETPDGYWNKRVSIERQERDVTSKNGSHAARSRWSKQSEKKQAKQRSDNATASEAQCGSDAIPEARSQKVEVGANAPTKRVSAKDFDRFWAVFPNKVEKKAAEKKFALAVKSGVDPERIVAAAASYATSEKVLRGFMKNPTTWLNGGCWDDEAPTPMAHPPPAEVSDDIWKSVAEGTARQ